MQLRCTCTMAAQPDGSWIKPADGYLVPDELCDECGGTGFVKKGVKFPDKSEGIFHNMVCNKCEMIIGFHFQFHGEELEMCHLKDAVCPTCGRNDKGIRYEAE